MYNYENASSQRSSIGLNLVKIAYIIAFETKALEKKHAPFNWFDISTEILHVIGG